MARPIKGKQVAIRLEPELQEKLQAQADADQRPLATFIRKLLRDHTSRPKPRTRARVQDHTEVAA